MLHRTSTPGASTSQTVFFAPQPKQTESSKPTEVKVTTTSPLEAAVKKLFLSVLDESRKAEVESTVEALKKLHPLLPQKEVLKQLLEICLTRKSFTVAAEAMGKIMSPTQALNILTGETPPSVFGKAAQAMQTPLQHLFSTESKVTALTEMKEPPTVVFLISARNRVSREPDFIKNAIRDLQQLPSSLKYKIVEPCHQSFRSVLDEERIKLEILLLIAPTLTAKIYGKKLPRDEMAEVTAKILEPFKKASHKAAQKTANYNHKRATTEIIAAGAKKTDFMELTPEEWRLGVQTYVGKIKEKGLWDEFTSLAKEVADERMDILIEFTLKEFKNVFAKVGCPVDRDCVEKLLKDRGFYETFIKSTITHFIKDHGYMVGLLLKLGNAVFIYALKKSNAEKLAAFLKKVADVNVYDTSDLHTFQKPTTETPFLLPSAAQLLKGSPIHTEEHVPMKASENVDPNRSPKLTAG